MFLLISKQSRMRFMLHGAILSYKNRLKFVKKYFLKKFIKSYFEKEEKI